MAAVQRIVLFLAVAEAAGVSHPTKHWTHGQQDSDDREHHRALVVNHDREHRKRHLRKVFAESATDNARAELSDSDVYFKAGLVPDGAITPDSICTGADGCCTNFAQLPEKLSAGLLPLLQLKPDESSGLQCAWDNGMAGCQSPTYDKSQKQWSAGPNAGTGSGAVICQNGANVKVVMTQLSANDGKRSTLALKLLDTAADGSGSTDTIARLSVPPKPAGKKRGGGKKRSGGGRRNGRFVPPTLPSGNPPDGGYQTGRGGPMLSGPAPNDGMMTRIGGRGSPDPNKAKDEGPIGPAGQATSVGL